MVIPAPSASTVPPRQRSRPQPSSRRRMRSTTSPRLLATGVRTTPPPPSSRAMARSTSPSRLRGARASTSRGLAGVDTSSPSPAPSTAITAETNMAASSLPGSRVQRTLSTGSGGGGGGGGEGAGTAGGARVASGTAWSAGGSAAGGASNRDICRPSGRASSVISAAAAMWAQALRPQVQLLSKTTRLRPRTGTTVTDRVRPRSVTVAAIRASASSSVTAPVRMSVRPRCSVFASKTRARSSCEKETVALAVAAARGREPNSDMGRKGYRESRTGQERGRRYKPTPCPVASPLSTLNRRPKANIPVAKSREDQPWTLVASGKENAP